MTDTEPRPADPFVRQVAWLVEHVGGKDALVRATGNAVSARTLDNWVRGDYPRAAVTGAVRDLDAWAAAQDDGYPHAAGAPRLVDSCGPAAATTTPTAPTQPAPRTGRRLAVAAVLLVAVTATVSVIGTLALVGDDEPAAEARAEQPAAPTSGDGSSHPELTGSLGANTFTDPQTLEGASTPIPPDTTVEVRCRFYSPVIPNVLPDGFWYLVDTAEWQGLWAPANSFMNGDVPGGPYTHNTDFAVPVCT